MSAMNRPSGQWQQQWADATTEMVENAVVAHLAQVGPAIEDVAISHLAELVLRPLAEIHARNPEPDVDEAKWQLQHAWRCEGARLAITTLLPHLALMTLETGRITDESLAAAASMAADFEADRAELAALDAELDAAIADDDDGDGPGPILDA